MALFTRPTKKLPRPWHFPPPATLSHMGVPCTELVVTGPLRISLWHHEAASLQPVLGAVGISRLPPGLGI